MKIPNYKRGYLALADRSHRFFSWWLSELRECVPARWRPKASLRLEAVEVSDGFRLLLMRPPQVLREGYVGRELRAAEGLSNAEIAPPKVAVWLRPAPERVLVRRVEVPATAQSHFANVLALEIDRWSPYRIDEVYAVWESIPGTGALREVDLRMIPRSEVETLRKQLSAAQLNPSFLALGPHKDHIVDLRSRTDQLNMRSIFKAAVFAVAMIGFVAVDWFAAKRDLAAWQERYRTEVKFLGVQRSIEDRIAQGIAAMEVGSSSVSAGRVLFDLSKALPETDWLTEVSLKKDTLIVRGDCENIERLLKALEHLAGDKEINLQGDASLDAGIRRQRFSLSFRLAGAT